MLGLLPKGLADSGNPLLIGMQNKRNDALALAWHKAQYRKRDVRNDRQHQKPYQHLGPWQHLPACFVLDVPAERANVLGVPVTTESTSDGTK